jgi:hypothetical protein
MTAPSGITRKKEKMARRQQALGKDGAAVCIPKKDGAVGAAANKEGAAVLHEQRWRWLSQKKILRKDGAGINFTKIIYVYYIC